MVDITKKLKYEMILINVTLPALYMRPYMFPSSIVLIL